MNNITLLAIDLAKNVFQLHGTDEKGKAILKKRITRGKLQDFIANLPACHIYMEACGSANYWGRKFESYGHEVKLINPKYVKPYVKRNKNDANDAAGIAAAARDPDMRFSNVKTEEQQDIQSVHRIRKLLVRQRTAVANQTRGLLAEYGIITARGISNVRKCLIETLGDNPNNLSSLILKCVGDLYEHVQRLDEGIVLYDKKIVALHESNETSKRLAEIPGIGKLGATILASMLGNGSLFNNGRHFAAFLGLVPRQHSSGNRERLLGMSKGGDTYIRTLLIHGGRSVVIWAKKKTDKRSMQINKLVERKGVNKAAVALANKAARIAWAVVCLNTNYDPEYKHYYNRRKKNAIAIKTT